jgi:hypothetical protein
MILEEGLKIGGKMCVGLEKDSEAKSKAREGVAEPLPLSYSNRYGIGGKGAAFGSAWTLFDRDLVQCYP